MPGVVVAPGFLYIDTGVNERTIVVAKSKNNDMNVYLSVIIN